MPGYFSAQLQGESPRRGADISFVLSFSYAHVVEFDKPSGRGDREERTNMDGAAHRNFSDKNTHTLHTYHEFCDRLQLGALGESARATSPCKVRHAITVTCSVHTVTRARLLHADPSYCYQAKPKSETSCSLATIVNCRTASPMRRFY